mmetsp:Transcript_16530/g.39682  ORF Transcript_16530/g.39682 Transcript_16530/m.39682 type:complete len:246 (-) Transcript_16530:569-1306(-)
MHFRSCQACVCQECVLCVCVRLQGAAVHLEQTQRPPWYLVIAPTFALAPATVALAVRSAQHTLRVQPPLVLAGLPSFPAPSELAGVGISLVSRVERRGGEEERDDELAHPHGLRELELACRRLEVGIGEEDQHDARVADAAEHGGIFVVARRHAPQLVEPAQHVRLVLHAPAQRHHDLLRAPLEAPVVRHEDRGLQNLPQRNVHLAAVALDVAVALLDVVREAVAAVEAEGRERPAARTRDRVLN